MKGSGRLITGSLRASAKIVGTIAAQAWALPSGVSVTARPTDDVNIHKYLRVAPSEPQQLVWMVPQYGIDYTVATSTGLKWNLI